MFSSLPEFGFPSSVCQNLGSGPGLTKWSFARGQTVMLDNVLKTGSLALCLSRSLFLCLRVWGCVSIFLHSSPCWLTKMHLYASIDYSLADLSNSPPSSLAALFVFVIFYFNFQGVDVEKCLFYTPPPFPSSPDAQINVVFLSAWDVDDYMLLCLSQPNRTLCSSVSYHYCILAWTHTQFVFMALNHGKQHYPYLFFISFSLVAPFSY